MPVPEDEWAKRLRDRMKTPEQRQAEAQAVEERKRLEDEQRARDFLHRALDEIQQVIQRAATATGQDTHVNGHDVGIGPSKGTLWFRAIDGAIVISEGGRRLESFEVLGGGGGGRLSFRRLPRDFAEKYIEDWLARSGVLRS